MSTSCIIPLCSFKELESPSGQSSSNLIPLYEEIRKFFLEVDTISEEKVTPLYNRIYALLPKELVLQEMDRPDSLIRKAILIFHAFHPEVKKELQGSSKPILLQATIEGKSYNLGIFKSAFKNSYYQNKTDEEGLVRERLNYVLTPNVVPETFIMELGNGDKGTFQLFLENYRTLGQVATSFYQDFSEVDFDVDPKNIREIAFAQLRKIDCDLSCLNLMQDASAPSSVQMKAIDGSHILPANLVGYRLDPLLENATLLSPLLTPFTDAEIEAIEKIDISETGKKLECFHIEESAIKINRCALLLLKEAVEWNKDKKKRYQINLRDLLAVVYISNPYAQESNIGCLPDKKTLFHAICTGQGQTDDEIRHRIQLAFAQIIEVKNTIPCINPKGNSHPTILALKNHYRKF